MQTLHSPTHIWHLDLPVTYPAPPIGTVLTVALATTHAIPTTIGPGMHVVLGVAAGRLVWVARLPSETAPLVLPIAVTFSADPTHARHHLTPIRVQVVEAPLDALNQPMAKTLALALADASNETGDGAGILGAATLLQPPLADQLAALLFPSSDSPANTKPRKPRRPRNPAPHQGAHHA